MSDKPGQSIRKHFPRLGYVVILVSLILILDEHVNPQIGNKMTGTEASKKYGNHLLKEKSPYLEQHAYNPVDWYPWGEEAFTKAKAEDKPIFLSIGYSTCHWCHVMAHESFENLEIAEILNLDFVPIKVDREERPDVDNIYMQAVIAATGSGGWPLSVFLTPSGKPFFGGTYFPPEDKFGRPGFKSLLKRIAQAWKEGRADVETAGEALSAYLDSLPQNSQPGEMGSDLLERAFQILQGNYDSTYGGFGNAPKFPMGHNLSFLLAYWHRTGNSLPLQMVEKTLEKMSSGGLYDHLGGGFHRYSVDQHWLVPHFEKMLYDQAILAKAYLEAYLATGNESFAQVAREIFDYVRRDLTHPQGGFYSAEDADSEGKEGKFYVWKPEEIKAVLGEKPGELFCQIFDVTSTGNFEEGESILHLHKPKELIASLHHLPAQELEEFLKQNKAKLLRTRSKRVRPHRDEKILTDWNGLMISSLAYGYQVLGETKYLDAAQRAARFVLENLYKNGRLYKHYRNGAAGVPGFLDDYAFFTNALIELYQADFDPEWLFQAIELTKNMRELFADKKQGAFFLAPLGADGLITRPKELYDGAIPAGNSIAILNLLRLGRLLQNQAFLDQAEAALKSVAGSIKNYPASYCQLLLAVGFYLGPDKEIILSGDPQNEKFKEMLSLVRKSFRPGQVVVVNPSGKSGEKIRQLAPFLESMPPLKGEPTAYVCQNFACQLPTSDIKKLEELLSPRH